MLAAQTFDINKHERLQVMLGSKQYLNSQNVFLFYLLLFYYGIFHHVAKVQQVRIILYYE